MKKIELPDIREAIERGIKNAQPVGAHRQEIWEDCWRLNAVPPYFSSDIVRYRGALYHAGYPTWERDAFHYLLQELAGKYLQGIGTIHEFGCGPGANLEALHDYAPTLIGYDWAQSAVDQVTAKGMVGRKFDMFKPDLGGVTLGGAVLTVHAMEQLGLNFIDFLMFLEASKPSVCIHIEPIFELYDPAKELDALAIQYHAKRRYLMNFLPAILSHHQQGRLQVLEVRRSFFGSMFHEAYSVCIWRPL